MRLAEGAFRVANLADNMSKTDAFNKKTFVSKRQVPARKRDSKRQLMVTLFPTEEMQDIASSIENFEASASIANTGTGARREGDKFEALVTSLWLSLIEWLESEGALLATVTTSTGHWTRVSKGSRSLYLPASSRRSTRRHEVPENWTRLDYLVEHLVSAYPGEADAIKRYAPKEGPYAGCCYPEMYRGLSTTFDDLIILEESGVLREKILLEYKTAKSSRGRQIDGNAHERLSFQIMQYLEVATRYPRCSFVVIANGAFARYRNKYHVNFHIQADRLSNFSWFKMEYLCTVPEYARFVDRLVRWIGDKGKIS